MITKNEALLVIIRDEANMRPQTRTRYMRVYKALRVIGFDSFERDEYLRWANYHDQNNNPRPWCLPKKKNNAPL